jgi:CRP-like cAMP-binding protein
MAITVENIKDMPLFRELDLAEAEALASRLRLISLQPEQALFQEGDPGRDFFIIASGHIRITTKVKNREKTLAILGKGDFFGEIALLDQGPRSATARASETAEIYALGAADFEHFILNNGTTAAKILKALLSVVCGRMRMANEHLREILSWSLGQN